MSRGEAGGVRGRLPACVVAMEACCGAHHLGRLFEAEQGHEVRLMSPEYVRPYVKAQKNDDRDAEAIAEAASRPTMRFVALKSRGAARHADAAPGALAAGGRAGRG
jgi:transposase